MGLYWILVVVRIILTFIPQTGYIHPDEYFQSIEVISVPMLCLFMLLIHYQIPLNWY